MLPRPQHHNAPVVWGAQARGRAANLYLPEGTVRMLPDELTDKLALGLGYGLLTMAVPVGAVLALVAHLSGEDLRKLVDEV